MEYYILIFLPISEWITLWVIPLSFLLPRKSLNFHFPQIRTRWAQISCITLETLQSKFTFSFLFFFFFQVLKLETWPWESHSATAGGEALLGDICHQPPLSSDIQFLAARCALNKQTKQGKILQRILQQQFEAEVNLRKFDLFFQPLPQQKNLHQVSDELSSAQISWNCNVKNVRQQFWSNCGLQHLSRHRILGGTLI